ncbi:uncharacterized protein LOC122859523 [Aphidius gifuensis]|uniref:uncharacterized protein LOC122859523 n=1 Tax=Aphidius gifuensis TaxID=684658 RepID=UPI001CDD76B5|nr:uncharacterized protein LOC122859523 [Aphidius gifuensis]XP_044019092.1 uncharacterized protein LOC122859523 [Aphidius gifuensis]
MDQLPDQIHLKNKFSQAYAQLKENPNALGIVKNICEIRDYIKRYNRSLGGLTGSRKKMTGATVALLTTWKCKLEHFQKKGGMVDESTIHQNHADAIDARIQWSDLESAFKNQMKTGMIINILHKNLDLFLEDAKMMLIDRLKNELTKKSAIKLNTILVCNFQIVKQEEIEIETKYFSFGCMEILQSSNLDDILSNNFEILKADLEEKEMRGSGWTFHETLHLEININEYVPLRGGSSTFIEMPD